MGVPGLSREMMSLKHRHPLAYFAGGDIYVDGLNFSGFIATELKRRLRKEPECTMSSYETIKNMIIPYVLFFRKFNPHSVSFVYDGFVSEERFKVRIDRINRAITSEQVRRGIDLILVTLVHSLNPTYKVYYSGGEAEDTIMRMIDRDPNRGSRRQFIISNDSDFFRYDISNPAYVEIIPRLFNPWKDGPIFTISLKRALCRLDPKLKIRSDKISEPGQTYAGTTLDQRPVFEFLNAANVYGFVRRSLGPSSSFLLTSQKGYLLSDCGKFYRQIGYGNICRQFNITNITEVQEWSQSGARMVPSTARCILGDELDKAEAVLRQFTLQDLFETAYFGFCQQHNLLEDGMANKVINHIRDVFAKKFPVYARVNSHKYSLTLHFTLAKSLLSSLSFLHRVTLRYPEIVRVAFEFNRDGVFNASEELDISGDSDDPLNGLVSNLHI